jgi:type VI secretion system secreted protein Hcp
MAIFAKYDGIDGEATDANHDRWIDVLSYEWGVHRPGGGVTGQSRRRGSAVIEDFVIVIEYEKASPKLLEKCLRGEIIPTLDVELTSSFGGSRATYLKYELENVAVTSYHVSGSGDEEAGPPVVVINNSFEEIKVTYTEYDSDGTFKGTVETRYEVESELSGTKKKTKKK